MPSKDKSGHITGRMRYTLHCCILLLVASCCAATSASVTSSDIVNNFMTEDNLTNRRSLQDPAVQSPAKAVRPRGVAKPYDAFSGMGRKAALSKPIIPRLAPKPDAGTPVFRAVHVQHFNISPGTEHATDTNTSHSRRALLSDVTRHNGAVMNYGAYVIAIWLGSKGHNDWNSGNPTPRLVNDFLANIQGASVFQRLTNYGVKPSLPFWKSITLDLDDSWQWMSDDNAQLAVKYVVDNYVESQYRWVLPDRTIFLVFSDKHMTPWASSESDGYMCDKSSEGACAWHSYFYYGGVSLKYAWVPSAEACLPKGAYCYISGFAANHYPPNGAEADAMMNMAYHEIVETLTNPEIDGGWYDREKNENADKCAWNFGKRSSWWDSSWRCYRDYNTQANGRKWLLQGFWDNKGTQACKWS